VLNRARSIARNGAAELIALELREALDALGRVLGQVTPDDVLGRVFASFCIGK
jgi:tRNA modification GTPase